MSSDSVSVSPSPLPRSRREGGLSRIPRVRPSHSHTSNAANEGPAVPSPRSNIPVPSGRSSASAQRSPERVSASSPVGTIRYIEASQGRRVFQGTMQPELAAGLPTTVEEPSIHDSLEDPDSSESAYDGDSNTLRQRHEPAMYVSLAASRYIMGSESSSSANRALTRRTSTTFYPRALERNSMASDGANYDSFPSSSSEELHAQGADNQSQPPTMESPFPPLLVSMPDEPTAITFEEIVTRHPEVANTVIQTGVVRVTDQRRTLGVMDGLRQVFARNRSERRDPATFETMNSRAESPASRGSLFTLFRQPSRTPVAAAGSPAIEIPAPEAASPATTMISPAAPVFTSEAVPTTEAVAKDMARVRRYLDMLAEKAAVGPEEQRAKYHQAWTSLATKFFDVESRDARDTEVHAMYTQMRAESTLHRRGLFVEMAGSLSALGLDEPSE
ncbi:hypothetical protein NUU61_006127 [Penicillium alfredii]|uniref:Uncharacterized protein n=1 Tax=Penicillium alfredii TaxID=1506179 RepID=A0A9W9F0E1_9EURO|nr:uncharacterized protein NUU61_006127 [Penicillium alfredii]KAJ5091257.1 hypothetical protein NUU61_006127 [Penicillium alfredii]